MNIATLTNRKRRELARRVNGGLEITLYWNPADNGISIDVHEAATDETISFAVPGDRALEAFNHPFAYLGYGIEHELELLALDAPSRN
jgi:hypothetical protein